LKDDTKALVLALPKICVGHSAAVLTGLEHNHKRWLSVTRAIVLQTSCNDRFLQLCFGLKHNQPPPLIRVKTADGGCRSMSDIVKADLRACTKLLSVAAAARRSPLLLLEARSYCWIWMLMEPDRTLILPLGACCALLPLLLLHTTALHAAPLLLLHADVHHSAAAPLPLCCRSAAPLLLLAKRQQHLGACQNCAARYLNFRPASGRGERRKTFREA
jgi:hypothetical protein